MKVPSLNTASVMDANRTDQFGSTDLGLGGTFDERSPNNNRRKIESVATIEEDNQSDSVNSRYSQEEGGILHDNKLQSEMGPSDQGFVTGIGFDKTYSRCSEAYKLALDSSRVDMV